MSRRRTTRVLLLLCALAVLAWSQTPFLQLSTDHPNGSTFGETVQFTTTASQTIPSTQVTYTDLVNGQTIGSCIGPPCQISTNTLAVGDHRIQSSAHVATGAIVTSNIVAFIVGQAATTTGLQSAPNPSDIGQSVTLTAGLQPPTATGLVSFFDGPTLLAAGVAVSQGGTAQLLHAFTTAGPHNLTATFTDPNRNYANSTSPVWVHTVNSGKTATTTSLASSQNPSSLGQAVTLTASVAPANATGSVTFVDGQTPLFTAALSGGTATFNTAALAIGSHSLSATYTGDSNFLASTSTGLTQLVKSPTTTNFTAAPNPSTVGQTVILSATVTSAGVTAVAPSGQVAFVDGSAELGRVTLANGTATLSISTLAAGTHPLAAVYIGDAIFNTSTSTGISQVVQKLTTTISLGSAPNPSSPGQAVTLTATVVPATATGTVTFSDGATPLQTVTVSNGNAALTTSALTSGSHSLTATYNGDATFNSSISAVVTQVVGGNVTLTALPNPSTVGQTVTMTATVSSTSATGTVVFLDGSTQLGSVSLTNGSAVFTTSTLAAGSHTLTAVFSGATSAPVVLTVNRLQSSINLSPSPNPASLGQPVTLAASVQPSSATGTVTFLDGGSVLGASTLVNGFASITVSTLTQGNHSLSATYAGDGTYLASTSSVVTETINSSTSTTTTLQVSPNPANVGQLITLFAQVTPAAATGSITFRDNGVLLGTATLANGAASLPVSTLAAGSHPLTAIYSGDSNYLTSTSTPVTETVQIATSTTLNANPTSTQPGQPVVLTAAVTPSTATGTVTFKDGNTTLGTKGVTAGFASLTVITLALGNHSLTATFTGTGNFGPSTSTPAPVSIGNLTPTTTTLTVSPQSAAYGDTVTLTAKVSPAAATGPVAFNDGSASLGSATLSGGIASITTKTLTAGAHSLIAVYGGDPVNATSKSDAVSLTINKVATTTTFTAAPNPSAPGQPVTLTATVAPSGATGSVTFVDGPTPLGTAALSGGRASIAIATLTAGNHSLSATYTGDTNYLNSTSAGLVQTVTSPGTGVKIGAPATLPDGTVGAAYSPQTFTATGGTGQLTWTLASSTPTGFNLTMSSGGVLSGTPQTAGTFTVTVQVRDSATPATTDARTYTVTIRFPALPAISVSVNSAGGQTVPQVSLGQAYPLALTGTFTLSFTPNAAALPANYTNPDVLFAGGKTAADVNIPANSTAAVPLPAVQVGTVAGTINVTLTALRATQSGQAVPLPTQAPAVTIPLPRLAPVIVAGSVKIANPTSSGFQVTFDASSNPRDLTSASLTFTAASGATLTGTQLTVSLSAPATTWFSSTAGVAAGGAFSVVIPLAYSGDPAALGTVSVTLTNSVGISPAVSGGR